MERGEDSELGEAGRAALAAWCERELNRATVDGLARNQPRPLGKAWAYGSELALRVASGLVAMIGAQLLIEGASRGELSAPGWVLVPLGLCATGSIRSLAGAPRAWRQARALGLGRAKACAAAARRLGLGLAGGLPNPMALPLVAVALPGLPLAKALGSAEARYPLGTPAGNAARWGGDAVAKCVSWVLDPHDAFGEWRARQRRRGLAMEGPRSYLLALYAQCAVEFWGARLARPGLGAMEAAESSLAARHGQALRRGLSHPEPLGQALDECERLGAQPRWSPEPGMPRLSELAWAVARMRERAGQPCAALLARLREMDALSEAGALGDALGEIPAPSKARRVRL